jgi:uncharacterized protein (DUF1330 family)
MVKVSQAWKNLEKAAAQKLGGIRLVRGDNFSQTMLDVEHKWLAIDCKWRTSLAVVTWFKKLEKDNEKIYGKERKVPILVIKQRGMRSELVVIEIDDFIKVVNDSSYTIEPKENEDAEN